MLLVIFTTIPLTETLISPSTLFLNTATAGQTSNSTKFNLRNFLILLQAIFSCYSTVAFTINWWSSYGLSFNRLVLRRRNTRNRNSQLVAQLCFVLCFGSMFAFFILRLSTCRVTKIFVVGWRKLLRKVDRGSILSYKCWPCCSFFIKLATCLGSLPSISTNQRAAFHSFLSSEIYPSTIELNLNKNYFLQYFHSISITLLINADITV